MFCPNTRTKFCGPYHLNHVIPRLGKNFIIFLLPPPMPTPTLGGSTIALPGLRPGKLKMDLQVSAFKMR